MKNRWREKLIRFTRKQQIGHLVDFSSSSTWLYLLFICFYHELRTRMKFVSLPNGNDRRFEQNVPRQFENNSVVVFSSKWWSTSRQNIHNSRCKNMLFCLLASVNFTAFFSSSKSLLIKKMDFCVVTEFCRLEI